MQKYRKNIKDLALMFSVNVKFIIYMQILIHQCIHMQFQQQKENWGKHYFT